MPEETTWTDCTDLLDNFSDPQIISALGKLPDDNRLTLFLVDVEQMSHEEVARIMDVAPGTVKSRTSRARAALKEQLRAHAKEMGFDGGKK
jgi:RNA polymerase sigma-70 factor (ECF subfamily)